MTYSVKHIEHAGSSAASTKISQGLPSSSTWRWRVSLTLLLGTYILNFVDRQIVNILAEPIRRDLQLTDGQIGMLTGSAFALFYAAFGIPIARVAERANRPFIIASAVACWSIFTTLCGLANSFVSLLVYRIGVGIGEAGGTPPAHSLIAESTNPTKRASALAFYHLGLPLGALCGLAFGGLVADAYGWRMAFIVAGAPGVIIALLVAALVREPRRTVPVIEMKPIETSFGDTFRYLARKRSFRLVVLGASLSAFVGYSHATFTAVLFLRGHGGELADLATAHGLKPIGYLGLCLGLASGLAGGLGTWLGGQITDRRSRRSIQSYCVVPALAFLAVIPFELGVFLSPRVGLALTSFVPMIFLASFWYGPVQATVQTIAPPHMRATASALLLLSMNLFGLGLGPLLIGATSDALAHAGRLGPIDGLRWALVGSTFVYLLAALALWRARTSLSSDIES